MRPASDVGIAGPFAPGSTTKGRSGRATAVPTSSGPWSAGNVGVAEADGRATAIGRHHRRHQRHRQGSPTAHQGFRLARDRAGEASAATPCGHAISRRVAGPSTISAGWQSPPYAGPASGPKEGIRSKALPRSNSTTPRPGWRQGGPPVKGSSRPPPWIRAGWRSSPRHGRAPRGRYRAWSGSVHPGGSSRPSPWARPR